MDPSKRRYLLTLRGRDDLSPAEQHELDMAESVHGLNWWMNAVEASWFEKAEQLGEFFRTHGEWPRQTGSEPSERALAAWHQVLRVPSPQAAPLTAEKVAHLDRVVPGWRQDNHDITWFRRADELCEFHREHGRLPSQTVGSREERILGTWAQKSRNAASRGALAQERLDYLDNALPTWRDRERNTWFTRADELAAFRRDHGRWPSRGSDAPGEARLAMWLSKAISHAATAKPSWTQQRAEYLDQVAPGWRDRA
jgi:hypothetical protein